jgi:predicted P-loop ATPase
MVTGQRQVKKTEQTVEVQTPTLFHRDGLLQEEIKSCLRYSDNGKVLQTIDNARTIIASDYRLSGKVRYNTLAYVPYVFGDLPWDKKDTYREWNNADDSHLFCFVECNYGIGNTEKISHALKIVSTQNSFNPVVEFLESLKWDGKVHIENLLPDYLGVEKNEYSIECMKLFMLGAISRAYKPGTKFDYMPVLVGPQGIGKSTFYKVLSSNDDWFSDNFASIEGDKAIEKLRGKWIIEFGELLAVKRAQDVESLKSFITSTIDTYRPPYERRTEHRPRQCVFCGTTNSTFFLTDKTGNRRYLPLTTRKEHVKKSLFENPSEVIGEFRQSWAEAMEIYRSGKFKLVLSEHLRDYVSNIQDEYLEEDTRTGVIQEYLDKLRDNEVCVIQIYREALGNTMGNPSHREINEIHTIMQNSITGWIKIEKKKRFGAWGPQWGYKRIKQREDEFVKIDKDIDLPFQ